MERKAEHDIARKLKVLNHAKEHGNISKTCRYFLQGGLPWQLMIVGTHSEDEVFHNLISNTVKANQHR